MAFLKFYQNISKTCPIRMFHSVTRSSFITNQNYNNTLFQLSTESMIMSQYDVIILDEVHERHLHGDFLIGLAKCLLKIRPELKLILMSATINIQLFADYFQEENVKIIEVPGRLYPIKLHYMPPVQDYANQIGKSEKLSPEPYVQIMQLIDNKYPSKIKYSVEVVNVVTPLRIHSVYFKKVLKKVIC